MEPALHLYDTQRGEKRPLTPLEPDHLRIYCCGPTVYDLSHIGHARAALAPDVLVRFLRAIGLKVTYVRNITDVDDKIIRRAQEEGRSADAVSTEYADAYLEDMDALNMLRPNVVPRVTDHIPHILELIGRLVEAGRAYSVDGDVYFRVSSFPEYGKLSGRKLEDLKAGARVEVNDKKESPVDFALWKAAKPGEPAWESPWGLGRPGWHIECSAMCEEHLGPSFDIHAGGRDLIFPHHENEIAQSQGVNGVGSYAQHWMHNGFVNFAGEKMAKSLGNFFTIREVLSLYQAEVLRYFLLSVQYRGPVNFDVAVYCPKCHAELGAEAQESGRCAACGTESSREALRRATRFTGLEEADERVASVYNTLERAQAFLQTAKLPAPEGELLEPVETLRARFVAAMQDDLNTAGALGTLSSALNAVNGLLDSKKGVAKDVRARSVHRFVQEMSWIADVLGVFGRDPEVYLDARRDLKAARIGLDLAKVEALIEARKAARAEKDWERADAVRDQLSALGVTLRDRPSGSSWTI